MTVIQGDCLEVMKSMDSNSVDFIVTDPPYGLNFMGKGWDKVLPSIDIWKEALRICKPGAFMACFGGTRTFHRLTCLIEDAGWEIRDCISWLYGSGFPKSHNKFGLEGYGTALKPAWEPIIICMKPLEGTFKQNAEKWGISGINIDESRIDGKKWPANLILDEESGKLLDEQTGISKSTFYDNNKGNTCGFHDSLGREKKYRKDVGGFNDSGGASRFFYCAKSSSRERNEGLEGMPLKECGMMEDDSYNIKTGSGNSRNTKRQNFHPTVKPLSLMRYIIKLLAPSNDPLLLDPFCGSGSTLIAAKELEIRSIGIELNEEYCEISRKRLE